MPYPSFPAGGAAASARVVFFSPFDPAFLSQATSVFCNISNAKSFGGAAIYNTNAQDPPAGASPAAWRPSWPFSCQAGINTVTALVTNPIIWGQRLGPRPAMLMTYGGGQVPN